jgi:hypothetical protein
LSDIKEAIYQLTKEMPNVAIILEEQDTEAIEQGNNVENIFKQIESLTLYEKEKLLSILSEISRQEPHSATPNEKRESDRLIKLEIELRLLKEGLHKIELKVSELIEKDS